MPNHHKSSDGSRKCCDALMESLHLLIPEIARAEAQETCGFYVPGRNRFAHVYHRGQDQNIRVYFRGDVSLHISDPTGNLHVQRREKIEKGWDKEFPFFVSISSREFVPQLAKLLAAVAYPLSESKRKNAVIKSSQVDFRNDDPFIEGACTQLSHTAYKRAIGARLACIAYYGASCSICGFNFETTYGKIGCGYIHVHHIKPISDFDREHEVDPIRDLRPVCPNCHAMLYHNSTPSCEDLKQKIKNSSAV